jgi:hypothetical protein
MHALQESVFPTPSSRAAASAITTLPFPIALLKIDLACPCAVTALSVRGLDPDLAEITVRQRGLSSALQQQRERRRRCMRSSCA